jgi:NAD(P)-dependent dehydrogenase (short-subunit alcohol dehydrogenase family)
MAELNGKVAIVTGAAGGIGAEVASRLAAEGAVVIVTDIDEAGGTALATEIGGGAVFRPLDATSEDGWAGMMAFANSEYGGLDILVNCAGFFKPHVGFEDTSLELWRQHFSVNADSVFLACKHAPAAMKPRGGGSIVNISTGLVHRMMAAAAAYCASKAATLAVSRLAAQALAPYNIRVNAILPGAVDTPMLWRNLLPGQKKEDLEAMLVKSHPIGRVGNPTDMADMILFLASDRSSFVTGAEIAIDGGQTL